MKPGENYIGVGCVFYCHDGKGNLLLQKRSKNCRDEQGKWDVGGGALRHGESFEQAVKREVKEEYCCKVIDLKYLGAQNVVRKNEGKKTHWIALLFVIQVDPSKVKKGVPRKMEEIGWFSLDKLPTPLHSMFHTHLEIVKKEGIL